MRYQLNKIIELLHSVPCFRDESGKKISEHKLVLHPKHCQDQHRESDQFDWKPLRTKPAELGRMP